MNFMLDAIIIVACWASVLVAVGTVIGLVSGLDPVIAGIAATNAILLAILVEIRGLSRARAGQGKPEQPPEPATPNTAIVDTIVDTTVSDGQGE